MKLAASGRDPKAPHRREIRASEPDAHDDRPKLTAMSLMAKIRELLTGEPEDPDKKAEWAAEKARIRAEKLEAKSQAMGDLPKYKPPE